MEPQELIAPPPEAAELVIPDGQTPDSTVRVPTAELFVVTTARDGIAPGLVRLETAPAAEDLASGWLRPCTQLDIDIARGRFRTGQTV
jgi:hypothetical protein